MARWLVIASCWLLVWGFSAAAQANNNCGLPNQSVGDCPIMLRDASGQPVMQEYTLPKPIGTVSLPQRVYFFSGPLCIVDRSVRTTMEGLYAAFSDAFLYPFRVILLLYIGIYAISFIFGLVNPKDFSLRLIKLAFVWVIITQNCVFYNYIYGGFISSSNTLVRIMSEVNAQNQNQPNPPNVATAQRNLYTSLDDLFGNVVGVDGLVGLGVALFAFITSGAQSMLSTVLLGLGVGSMALALARALATLGIAMTATAFFLLFTPMFLAFFLFQNTKRLFDNWLSMLISFALQPFIIFAFLVMMRATIDNAANIRGVNADQKMDINSVVREITSMIDTKIFNPPVLNNQANANIYLPDRARIIDFMQRNGIAIDPNASDTVIQQKFFEFFMPKLLFWFLINMIMAGFIKEVPGFAQRLAGYISAPALGATENSIFSKGASSAMGVELPGLSRSSGGNILEAIGQKMGANATVKRAGLAGLGALGAMGMEGLRGDKARDGASAENKAKDGEVKRAAGAGEAAGGQAMARAGTLKELLGDKTMEREGPKAGGIGSSKDASREGLKAVGVGEPDAAMRKETVNDNMRLMEQARTNQALQRGVELANSGDMNTNIHFRRKEKMDETPRDNRIAVQALEMKERKEDSTVYSVNGRTMEVSRANEMSFLSGQLNQVEKDLAKTKTMGTKGKAEAQNSLQQLAMLRGRLDVLQSEKKALDAAEMARQQLIRQGQTGEQLRKLEQELPKLVQKNDVAGVAKLTAQLKASKNQKLYGQLIAEMENLQGTMRGERAKRADTVAAAAPVGGGTSTATATAAAKPPAPPPPPKRSAAQRQRDVLMRLANVRARVKEEEEKRIKELMEKNPGLTREQGKQTYDYYAKQVEERTRAIERELPTILQERDYNRLTQLSRELNTSSQSAEYQTLRAELEGLRDQLIDERASPTELARQAMEERLAQFGERNRDEDEKAVQQKYDADLEEATKVLGTSLAQAKNAEEREAAEAAFKETTKELDDTLADARKLAEEEKALQADQAKLAADKAAEEARQLKFDQQLAENEMTDAQAAQAWEQEKKLREENEAALATRKEEQDDRAILMAGANYIDSTKDAVERGNAEKIAQEKEEKFGEKIYAGMEGGEGYAAQIEAAEQKEEGGMDILPPEQRRLKDKKSYQVSKKSMKLGPDGEEITDELYEQHLALEELRKEQEAKEEAAEKEQEVLIAENTDNKDKDPNTA